jgi:hypothetical protein
MTQLMTRRIIRTRVNLFIFLNVTDTVRLFCELFIEVLFSSAIRHESSWKWNIATQKKRWKTKLLGKQ